MPERSAFDDLLTSYYAELGSIMQLIDIAERQEQIESNVGVNETLLQASLVLAIAQTEGFTKALVAEFTDSLNRSGVPLRRISERIRHLHTRQAVQELASCDDGSRAGRIRSLRQQLNLYWDDDRALRPVRNSNGDAGLISKKKLQRSVTSVNGAQVRDLLDLLGCERNVCAEAVDLLDPLALRQLLESGVSSLEREEREEWEVGGATANVGEKLTDLVSKRNAIAHGNGKVSMSKGDVLEALAFLCSFASLLQDAVTEHLRATLTLGG